VRIVLLFVGQAATFLRAVPLVAVPLTKLALCHPWSCFHRLGELTGSRS
jgi:hypothetical protein